MKIRQFIINHKKQFIIAAISILTGLAGTFFLGAGRPETMEEIQQGIAKEVLRFHVRANSDSKEDQRVKMLVKERVVSYLQPLLENMQAVEETKRLVSRHMDELKEIAEEVLRHEEADYGVTLKLGQSTFPSKTYGDCTFPAGTYDALIINLGTALGHNWWCMLYPGLCFVDETHAIVSEEKKQDLKKALTDDEYKYVIRFKLLDIS